MGLVRKTGPDQLCEGVWLLSQGQQRMSEGSPMNRFNASKHFLVAGDVLKRGRGISSEAVAVNKACDDGSLAWRNGNEGGERWTDMRKVQEVASISLDVEVRERGESEMIHPGSLAWTLRSGRGRGALMLVPETGDTGTAVGVWWGKEGGDQE